MLYKNVRHWLLCAWVHAGIWKSQSLAQAFRGLKARCVSHTRAFIILRFGFTLGKSSNFTSNFQIKWVKHWSLESPNLAQYASCSNSKHKIKRRSVSYMGQTLECWLRAIFKRLIRKSTTTVNKYLVRSLSRHNPKWAIICRSELKSRK